MLWCPCKCVWDSVCPLWHVAKGPRAPCRGGLGMARGRTTSLTIRLTPAQRQTLVAWQRTTTIRAGLARRGRMVLLLADGVPITDIAATVGISRRHIYKWVQRFQDKGIEGLTDKAGRGHRRGPCQPARAEQYDVSA